jgi:hypothetical protein
VGSYDFSREDVISDDGLIKIARPWMLVKDQSGDLLRGIQFNMKSVFSKGVFGKEMKCIFHSLLHKIDPSKILQCCPMFYSPDRQIVFIIVASNDRRNQNVICREESWHDTITKSPSLNVELERQKTGAEKEAGSKRRPKPKQSPFYTQHLIEFTIFLGNAIRHFIA